MKMGLTNSQAHAIMITSDERKEMIIMTEKYYYKCYYTNGTWDLVKVNRLLTNPNEVAFNCYQIDRLTEKEFKKAIHQFDIEYVLTKIKNFFKRGVR